ncbi:MAG TPA: aldehyde dehydrogenase family protein, partial [Chloroflexota bacterium]|nr:aldehyde dehydrogenase family protein [Chloroflexota bacterium]
MAETKRLKYFANGEWKESRSGKYMPVTDSSTGSLIAETPACTAGEVSEAVEAAAAAFPAWADKPIAVRTQLLFHFKSLIEQHIEELTFITAQELGKNLDESRGEYVKIIEACETAVAAPMLMQGRSLMNVSTGHDTVMYREPLGVFAGIAPFNFPAMIPFGWFIPLAITTGNTYVLKAASMVPLSSIRLVELLQDAGLPKGVVNMVTCSRNEADILLTHPAVKGVTFVGSTSVGKQVYSKAAAHGKRVQAQTEAKNHGIVLRDASLERAARGIINSTFGCAGMRCMALPVICVENAVADQFIDYLVKFARERVVGCAYDPKTELGPVVSAEHKKFVTDWIAKGVQEGAELLLDGRNVVVPGFEGGFFIGPTIFDRVTEEMSCGREEVFGPVTFIKRIDDFEEGLAIANGNPFANGSCIFT